VAYVYFIFASITAAAIVFIHVYVPETKGKSLDELLTGRDDASAAYSERLLGH
jgi:hypothetical protein